MRRRLLAAVVVFVLIILFLFAIPTLPSGGVFSSGGYIVSPAPDTPVGALGRADVHMLPFFTAAMLRVFYSRVKSVQIEVYSACCMYVVNKLFFAHPPDNNVFVVGDIGCCRRATDRTQWSRE